MTAGRAEEQAAAAAVQAGMAFADQRASVSERLMVESPMVSTEQTTWADLPADVTWPKQSQ